MADESIGIVWNDVHNVQAGASSGSSASITRYQRAASPRSGLCPERAWKRRCAGQRASVWSFMLLTVAA